tara:strand:+ start:299 stop:541 length:243 start_codon:yes stop_codon:yes gene_type:complete
MEKLKIDVCKNLNNIEMAINTYIEKRELEISKTEDLKNIPPWDRRYKYIKQEQINAAGKSLPTKHISEGEWKNSLRKWYK